VLTEKGFMKMKMPHELIRLTRITMNITQAKAKINNKLSSKFEFIA
jgi:hypothetical protein